MYVRRGALRGNRAATRGWLLPLPDVPEMDRQPILPYAMFRSDAFRFTQGEPKFYQSSAWLERGFCANCGTPVCDRYLKGSDRVYASIGGLDHPEDWPPNGHWGVESQVPWLTIDDGLPRTRTEDEPEFIAAKAAAEQGEG